jgi:hypothetical protein
MRLGKILARAAIGIGLAVAAPSAQLSAQIYQCPDGYYYDPNYGCLPLSYYYGPPTYILPFAGFGFFYGGNWGHRGGFAHGGHPVGGGHFVERGGHPGGGAHFGGGGGHPGGGHGH